MPAIEALTEHQTLNSSTPAFDVQVRYFAGPDYGQLCKDGIYPTLHTWTDPDTPPNGWTEITSRVAYASAFSQSWQSNSITWQAQLSGWNYDEALLRLGLTLVCWRRIWRPTGTVTAPAGWQAWQRWYIGELVSRSDRNNYQNGKPWQRTVTGVNFQLSSINAPRVTAGKIRITDGATVTGTAELADPELERDQGEFVGGGVSVELRNITDGNRNTVYISSTVPQGAAHPFPSPVWDGGSVVTELFIKPHPGWSLQRTWWVEVYNKRSQNNESEVGFQCAVWEGGKQGRTWTISKADDWDVNFVRKWPKLQVGHACVFVANRASFDEYMGSANGAAFIADISQFADVELSNDAAIYAGNQIVAWSPGGATRHYEFPTWNGTAVFNDPTLDSNALTAGQSWWSDTGNGVFVANDYPHPGANGTGEGPVWVKVLLPENECRTLDEITASSTTIRLDSYRGWLTPLSGSYSRGIDALGHVFRWTSRDGNGLHGVTWENAPGAPVPASTRCYPYANGIPQTGYPLTATHLVRRKTPVIQSYRVWWSQYDARDYLTPGWPQDYYKPGHVVQGNTQSLRLSDACGDGTNGYLWVRTIMYAIDRMADDGRAKINEIEADLAQLALDLTATAALDGGNSGPLAFYLWNTWCGLHQDDFNDLSYEGLHRMGQHALAITPVNRVLDDLAGATGCLVDFSPNGGIIWRENPWWPKNSTASRPIFAFDPNWVRDEVTINQSPAQVDFVILNALSIEGDPHSVRVVYPTPLGTTEPPIWAMTTEVNDRVLAQDADGSLVAQMELERLALSNKGATLTVKGVGEWARPGQRVGLWWDYAGANSLTYRNWLIEQVQVRLSESNGQRGYATTLQLTGFRS